MIELNKIYNEDCIEGMKRIPSNPMSRRAIAHKYAMIKDCNYFSDPLGDPHIICYDSDTQRSAQREATAAKHGLKVVEADE